MHFPHTFFGVRNLFVIIKKKDLLLGAALFLTLGIYLSLTMLRPSVSSFSPQAGGERVIVVDAGHGGEDGGAVSADGVVESHINLAIAQDVNALLTFLGEDTRMTRTEDVSIHSQDAETLHQKKVSDLKNRVELVNSTPNAILLSIHQNSLPKSKSVHGAQVFYGKIETSDLYARSMQEALNHAINDKEKDAKEIAPTIYLMKNVTAPAVLVECGFLSNSSDSTMLQQEDYQKKLAVVIAAGFLNAENSREEAER